MASTAVCTAQRQPILLTASIIQLTADAPARRHVVCGLLTR